MPLSEGGGPPTEGGAPSSEGTVPLSKARTRLVRRLSDRKSRPREARVLIEGPRAVEAAFEAGAPIEFVVFVSSGASAGDSGAAISTAPPGVTELLERLSAAGIALFSLAESEFGSLADTESPQGILAVSREPSGVLPDPAPAHTLVLDRVQDPGNVGTLIRSAAALGCGLVVALDGTVDPWNPKVVRSAAGEIFRVPVVRTDWASFDGWRESLDLALLVADGSGVDVRAYLASHRHPSWSLLIGNEGAGPRAEALAAATGVLALPLMGGVESLNAAMAGSILLWALGPEAPSSPSSPPRRETHRV